MKPEELKSVRAALVTPWNDLREQRVLGRVIEARQRERGRRVIWVGAAGAIAAAAVIVFFFARHHATLTAASTLSVANSTAETASTIPAPADSRSMTLADGSEAVLLQQARLQVDEQSPSRVHITQSAGTVRYEVRPDPSRAFVVAAGNTTVRVRGTIFTVDVDAADHTVDVRVDRGRVEVETGSHVRVLNVGEAIHVVPGTDVPEATNASSARPLPGALLDRADKARVAGNDAEAASALESLVAFYPHDARVPGALFTLGRVERSRARYADSATAFDRCAALGGVLEQDALGEAVASWVSAGKHDAAQKDAELYLKRFPKGVLAGQMRGLIDH